MNKMYFYSYNGSCEGTLELQSGESLISNKNINFYNKTVPSHIGLIVLIQLIQTDHSIFVRKVSRVAFCASVVEILALFRHDCFFSGYNICLVSRGVMRMSELEWNMGLLKL
jgi:hypothetical protein